MPEPHGLHEVSAERLQHGLLQVRQQGPGCRDAAYQLGDVLRRRAVHLRTHDPRCGRNALAADCGLAELAAACEGGEAERVRESIQKLCDIPNVGLAVVPKVR